MHNISQNIFYIMQYVAEYFYAMHIIILHCSVLIKFVPTTTIKINRFIPIEGDAIAVSNGTHV